MSPTISKDQSLKPQGRLQLNAHIPGVAGLFFAVILTVDMLGGIWLSTNGFLSDSGMAIWTIGWGLVGLYILLGLKVASQWQKAVVLRLGKFHKLATARLAAPCATGCYASFVVSGSGAPKPILRFGFVGSLRDTFISSTLIWFTCWISVTGLPSSVNPVNEIK